jgi:hypothetical protein
MSDHVKATIEDYEERGFRFELVAGGDLDITLPHSFGAMGDKDLAWFRRYKPDVILYLRGRKWHQLVEVVPFSGIAFCPVIGCPEHFHEFKEGRKWCGPAQTEIRFIKPGLHEWLCGAEFARPGDTGQR